MHTELLGESSVGAPQSHYTVITSCAAQCLPIRVCRGSHPSHPPEDAVLVTSLGRRARSITARQFFMLEAGVSHGEHVVHVQRVTALQTHAPRVDETECASRRAARIPPSAPYHNVPVRRIPHVINALPRWHLTQLLQPRSPRRGLDCTGALRSAFGRAHTGRRLCSTKTC
ncbi:hypothetical protein VTO73DRAFT_10360 [Trametes versicolor]